MVEMGQVQKSAVETRIVGICKRWMATGSPGTADSQFEPNGKRVMDAVEDYLESCAKSQWILRWWEGCEGQKTLGSL